MHTKTKNSKIVSNIDLAAQIITGIKGNPIETIAVQQLNLTLHPLRNTKYTRIYDTNGKLILSEKDKLVEEIFNSALHKACHTFTLNNKDFIDHSVLIRNTALANKNFNNQPQPSLGACLVNHLKSHQSFKSLDKTDLALLQWHIANLEFANGIIHQTSLHHWDQDDDEGFEGWHCLIKNGYGQITDAIASGHSSKEQLDIRLNKVVTSITKLENDYLVECKDGALFECDLLVVTLPLGVLKAGTVRFDPELPEWKRSAIQRMGYGSFNKVVMVFPRLFWNQSVDAFGTLGGKYDTGDTPDFDKMRRGESYLVWNLASATGLPILVLFTSGIMH